jgi:predicted ATPase
MAKQGGGLQEAVESRGGVTKIRCLAARQKTHVTIEVELGEIDIQEPTWRYVISFKNFGGGITKNKAQIVEEIVYAGKKKILDRPTKNEDNETLQYSHLEQITANKDFRDIQNFFEEIEYLNVVPQLVRESASTISASKEDYYGRNFLEKLSKYPIRQRDAYFKRINEVLKIAVPQLEKLQFVKDDMGVPHLEAKYIHWRPQGGKQQEQQFSDGTLRLIGFLFALLDFKNVMLLEEPEINLHSEIIHQLPEFISKLQRARKGSPKQVIITTHSYEMLDNKGIGLNEVLVLENTHEGTNITAAGNLKDVEPIIKAGFSMAEAVLPVTKPKDIEKITQLKIEF